MTGKVWLVGAGPGDAGLLTLRGKEVLQQAEVVVYDALISPGVLSLIPDAARVIYAGKRAGKHTLPQSEINRVLLEEARKGLRVVRLKGGDPFLFGRGGEELEALAANGIPFEIVPGVTSAFAVPAYNGIPVTHRGVSSGVHVLTGHRKADGALDINFEALAQVGGTLVFLMGVASLSEIVGGLLGAGMNPDTPSAALERGATASQRRISAPLSALETVCASENLQPPAVLVVGEVCALADKFAWYEKRPLAGVRVLVTRPKEAGSALSELLRRDGAEVLELPAIVTKPVDGSKPLSELERGAYDWLVFTSQRGVQVFFEKLLEVSDIRALGGVRVAVIGEGTRKALARYGVKADFLPSVYDAETLGRELAQVCADNARILIPRARVGSPALIRELNRGGRFQITDFPVYDTLYAASSVIDAKSLLERGEIDFAVFTSASTVRGFVGAVGDADFSNVRAVCIGKQTRAAALEYGMRTWVSEKATLQSLAERVRTAAAEMRGVTQS